MAELTLLTRAGCHLCATAEETVARIAGEAGLTPSLVDVDGDDELRAEYGDRVPVVLLDGREHSYFTVDVVRLRQLARAGLTVLVGDAADLAGAQLAVDGLLGADDAPPVAVHALADLDVDGSLRAALGARPDELWVLRPDAHVAAVVTEVGELPVALARLLATPAPRPVAA